MCPSVLEIIHEKAMQSKGPSRSFGPFNLRYCRPVDSVHWPTKRYAYVNANCRFVKRIWIGNHAQAPIARKGVLLEDVQAHGRILRELMLGGGAVWRIVDAVVEAVSDHRGRHRGLHRVLEVVHPIGGDRNLTVKGLMVGRVVVAAAGARPLLRTVEAECTGLLAAAGQWVILDALTRK